MVVLCSTPELASAMSPLRMASMATSPRSVARPVAVLNHENFHVELDSSASRQWMVAVCEGTDRSGGVPEHTGACRKLLPAFEKYAKDKWDAQLGRLQYGEVDCAASPALCEEFGILPGSIVHFVGRKKVDSWTKLRQRAGILLFPWISRQVDEHESKEGSLSKAVFEEASDVLWDVKYVAAVHILFVMFFAVPTAFAKLAGQVLWMVAFAGTLFMAVATLRLLSAPLHRPGSPSDSASQKERSQKDDDHVSALVQDVLF